MDPENRPSVPKNRPDPLAMNLRAASVALQVGCLTVFLVLGAVLGGIWLDNTLGTKPIFILLFVLGSVPVTFVLTYWLAVRSVKNANPTGPNSSPSKSYKEEDTGE